MDNRELKKIIKQQRNEIDELNVLVDTLQSALGTTQNYFF